MAMQERNHDGKPLYVAGIAGLNASATAFAHKNRFTQSALPQMFVDSTEDPITVTVSEICFAGEIKKGGPQ
ncbi:hypothetical protein [Mesorhizobium humile]|uniref:Uncharacterized protein n=1 Tax=Mesorhizobium humile TaxID=3072313 RepID=A0ABU4YEU3_9HYPH|nr:MULTISPECIES: hypothetical protein [unclassified Mesorhizobium]MDX8459011.1 hypothetical protein [Mesorhizobium sp. VK2D]MDX8484793.1 hypothetical protein [Mesorhizobium sp. VK2B]